MSVLHLSRATAIFVVDWCQFGPSWIFGLKIELMACTDLAGVTIEQSCHFPDKVRHTCPESSNFQPKNPARAKLAAINNKNGCGTAVV